MSWLYSIVFAGLLFSSQNADLNLTAVQRAGESDKPRVASQDDTERFEQSYPLNANGRVSVSNVNGSIVVEAWDRNEVHLVAVKTADSKETLASVEVKVDARPDSFRVEADYDQWKLQGRDQWKGRRLEVQFKLQVPRGAVLDEVGTVNGSVTVSNFSNMTKISAVNGDVRATNLRGTANLSTVNGEVVADFDRLETGSRISLNTVNGKVNLIIPSDSNATLRADSVNGPITNDFGLPVRKGQYVGRDLYGRIGSGEVHVKLSSVNGPLTINRKQDGRSVSPATNLLPQKNKDNEDWDDDNDQSIVDTEKLNREVAEAVKASQRDAAMAVRETEKAAAKATKDLTKLKPPKMPKIDMPKIEIPKVALDAVALSAIDKAELQETMREGMEAQREAFAKLRETNFLGSMPRVERRSDAFPVKGVPKVTIDAKGSSIRVRGWDKQEVQYTVTQLTDARNRTPVTTSERHTDSSVDIKVINNDPERPGGSYSNEMKSVRIEVFVPRKTNLKVTTDGEIRVDGVSGELEIMGADEAINVRDGSGKLRVTNADGLVRVIGFDGELDAKTVDGNVYLEGTFQKITGNAVDGTIVLTISESTNASITSNTEIEAENVNVIEAGANKWKLGNGGAKYTFHFTDGTLILRSPADIAKL